MTEPAAPVSDLAELTALVGKVPDPEVPVLTIADLGVLRSVDRVGEGVLVTITPTYSGCPAMDHIREAVMQVLIEAGVEGEVRTVYSPAWTTDWISADGRSKLRDYGIAPPRPVSAESSVAVDLRAHQPVCPRCGSADTEQVAEFGSTACKSLWRCLSCLEPFDHFKEL